MKKLLKKKFKRKVKKKKIKLPKEILIIKNPDKFYHENWKTPKNRDPLDIPHPYRIVICGKPNSGKSMLAKNILLRASKPFEKIIICHYDGHDTKEYEDLGDIKMLDYIPNPRDKELFDPKYKTLLIFDDLEFQYIPKEQKKYLDRFFGYSTTHKNMSIILCAQNLTNIPVAVRRMANVFIMFKVPDMELLYLMGRKLGIKKDNFNRIFEDNIKSYHDSIWFDLSAGSPFPLRRNGYLILDINKYKDRKLKKEINK